MPHHGLGPIRFASYLALAWLGLVVYGSLHPFAGWRDTGVSPFAFLEGGWPRYWTVFDLAANVAVYLPLGFFLGLALSRLRGRFTGMALATLLAGAISFGLESVQTWLPSRVPSNLDLACNTLGGLLGALWAQAVGPRVLLRITALEHKLIAPIPHAELGLTLLGLWLLVPLSPETLLFGAGDLRQMFALTGAMPFAAESFVMIEASITAFNVLAVGLIVRMLCARLAIAYLITPLFLLLCLVVATCRPPSWSARRCAGLADPGRPARPDVGTAILLVAMALPATPRLMIAALALMAGTVLVNLAPPNPYSAAALAAWRQGHFLNFNGLTRLIATLWPFLTLPFLMLSARRH
jgi:VanZ family protein